MRISTRGSSPPDPTVKQAMDRYLFFEGFYFELFLGEKVVNHPEKRPNVPKVTDHIATPMRSRRSFVHKNALDAMISEPTALDDPQFVDSAHGNRQTIKTSGMVPNFMEKKEFGLTPGYIKKLKKEKMAEQERWEHEQQEIIQRREMMKLQDEEREAILQVCLR
jgi:hypothetical protein